MSFWPGMQLKGGVRWDLPLVQKVMPTLSITNFELMLNSKLGRKQKPGAKTRCCWLGDHLSFPLCNAACLYENWVPFVGFLYTFPVQVFSTRSGTNLVFYSERLSQCLRQRLLSTAVVVYDCSLIFKLFVNKINISCAWVWPKTSEFYWWYFNQFKWDLINFRNRETH